MGDNVFCLKEQCVKKLLSLSFKEEKTRISPDALKLMTNLIQLFIEEAVARAEIQAGNEAATSVEVDQLEKILPQLLLDF